MWSTFHYLYILSPFIFAILLYFLTKYSKPETKRLVGIILSVICIILLLLRNIEIFVKNGYKADPEIFPFQICHFANFILLFAFLFKSKTMHTIAFCFNLPFAFLSILFANSLEHYQTVLTFRGIAYIFGHMLIVGVALWAYLADMIAIEKKTLIKGTIFLSALFVASVPLNNLFNYLMPAHSSNYFYSMLPEEGTPLELAYGWGKTVKVLGMKFNPIYLLVTLLFGLATYFLFGLAGILFKRLKSRKQN